MPADLTASPWSFDAELVTYTEDGAGNLHVEAYNIDGVSIGGAMMPAGTWSGPVIEQE